MSSAVPMDNGRLMWALRRAHHEVEGRKSAQLRRVGLDASHYALMINISLSPGITGADLARAVGVSPQNVASLLRRLRDRGLVVRRTHPQHSQVQELFLTEAGEDLVRRADQVVVRMESALARELGPSDYRALLDLLARVRSVSSRLAGDTADAQSDVAPAARPRPPL